MAYSNGNWKQYWKKNDSLKKLLKMFDDMDETLHRIEKELGKKLLAKDHLEIIMALEDRIAELESIQNAAKGIKFKEQLALFDQ